MSGQRHLRNTAVMIAAFAGVSLLWLAIDLGRSLVRPGWWLEALLYGGFLAAAFGLLKGSRLAWFASVLIFAGGLVAGIEPLLDWALAGIRPVVATLPMSLAMLAGGAYGLWSLLMSPKVRAVRAAQTDRTPWPMAISLGVLAATILCLGWFIDRLSGDVLAVMGAQAGIAALFVVVIGFVAARKGRVPLRWSFLPLAVAAGLIVASLPTIQQLRDWRPLADALRDTPLADRPGFTLSLQRMPSDAGRLTKALRDARDRFIERAEARTLGVSPFPLMTVLGPARVVDPDAVASTRLRTAQTGTAARDAIHDLDLLLDQFTVERERIIADLPQPMRSRVATRFAQETESYRSHYRARIQLLTRAREKLQAILGVLAAQSGRYEVDWRGAVIFEDAQAAATFHESRAALEELAVWDSRLRTDGATLAATQSPSRWLEYARGER
ncbi:hypothetical protein [Iodidimonas sp. SYSU 1G8]|uniref:hypothetical protein n=1 Tax=Iodidimonas sp. SYSU 1G8 TaxID=3133967 RepID=UPI0031FE7E18